MHDPTVPLFLLLLLPYPLYGLITQNGSTVELSCRPAEIFIRTHMAPDFVSPQLVRRLEWYHDDTLVANYQQGQSEDSSTQWWVSDPSLSIGHPFYSLRIQELRPEHSGAYKCRLETDPLFSLDLSTSTVELAVMVPPVPPSQPEIKGITNSSVTLSWSHSTSRSHRPILRYSVLVRGVRDGSEYIIPALSNATSVIVDNLSSNSPYSFSVRAENTAGQSIFGQETIITTKGHPPVIGVDIDRYESTSDCIRLLISHPLLNSGDVLFYRVILSIIDSDDVQERNVTSSASSSSESEWIKLCELKPYSSYSISVQLANTHGLSPPKKILVQTDQGVPDAPPPPRLRPSIGAPTVHVTWKSPNETRGILSHYSIQYRRVDGVRKDEWNTQLYSLDAQTRKGLAHRMDVHGLRPNTRYTFRIRASTMKGEGPASVESLTRTDVGVPAAHDISNVSIECRPSRVRFGWREEKEEEGGGGGGLYTLSITNSSGIFNYNVTGEHLVLSDLVYEEKYSVHLTTFIKSHVDSSVYLASSPSIKHHFVIKDGCVLLSSLCSIDTHCLPLRSADSSGRYAFLVIILVIIIFLLFTSFLAYMLKRKCVDLKELLKKKEKNVLIDELSPLVYNTEGMDQVPVELFYGMCEDLSRNNNLKYKQLFDRINEMTDTEMDGGTPSEGGGPDASRDRYANIVATETSRVRIQETDGGSDYINANYVDSCDEPHAYIATQAPLPSTFGHFWSMVWQERINVIVVITNLVEDGRRKCDQYWPSTTGQAQQHGNYQVSLLSQSINAHFVHRILSLRIAKSVPPTDRRIHHIHFSSWPDHGVPSSVFPLLSFTHFIADIHSTGPLLVHCSAGVGRSGSFILIDSMRRRLLSHRSLNLPGHLIHIRRQREKVVQTIDQFIFCHEVVRQMARHGITRVPATVFPRYVQFLVEEASFNGKMRLQSQFDDICKCTHNDRCSPVTQTPIVLPGFHRLDEFIVAYWNRECTQLWKTVWEYGCETIVLIHPDTNNQTFWNRMEDEFDGVNVSHEEETKVVLSNADEELSVTLLYLSERAMDTSTWSELERIQSERVCSSSSSPLLIISSYANSSPIPPPSLISTTMKKNNDLCYLSMCRPYLLCALTSLACQLEKHSCIDVVQTIDAFHRIKCSSIPSRHVLEYLYERLLLLVNLTKQ